MLFIINSHMIMMIEVVWLKEQLVYYARQGKVSAIMQDILLVIWTLYGQYILQTLLI